MVQSIWLEFDEISDSVNKETAIQTIKEVMKKSYKTYSCYDRGSTTRFQFYFKDFREIKEIADRIGIEIDDTKMCSCGCMSTNLETLTHFIQLELMHGPLVDQMPDLVYFQLGQNVYGEVGMYYERLNIIRYILEDMQKQLREYGIKAELDLSDCEMDVFENYPNKEDN